MDDPNNQNKQSNKRTDNDPNSKGYKTRIYRPTIDPSKSPTSKTFRNPARPIDSRERPPNQYRPAQPRFDSNRPGNSNAPRRPFPNGQQNRFRGNARPQQYSQHNGESFSDEREFQSKVTLIPPIGEGVVRVIPICGTEWVGTNMTAVEYGDDIIIIDAGFGFSNPDTPGIDYTIPDTKYLELHKHKIRAIVITHGHMDHVGGLPYIMAKLGNPPIYTRQFGAVFIQKRMEEFPQVPKLNIHVIDNDTKYIPITENIKVKFFGLTHSIPDSTGVIVQTPLGGIVSTGDVRVENTDGVPAEYEVNQYKFFKDEKILLATIDSTGVQHPGWATSENLVRKTVDGIIKNTNGRLFIAAFSSQVERLISFLESAKEHGRMVVIEGRSMKSNLAIAEFLELTKFDHVIPIEDLDKHPPHKLLIVLTGGQGEQYSALQRISTNSHKFIKLRSDDTIVLSSSVVPGNDHPVDKLKDELFRSNANIITYMDNVVHASGHGKKEELKWIHQQIPYKFFVPVHGRHWFLRLHAKLAHEMGVPKENIVVPENGTVIEIYDNGEKIRTLAQKAVDSTCWIVDGSYVGPLHQVVMDDRMKLSENGMFVVIATLDLRNKTLVKSPDIVSRGFVYLRESRELLNRVRTLVKRTCEMAIEKDGANVEIDMLKKALADRVSKYIFQKTQKEPIVIPVVVIA